MRKLTVILFALISLCTYAIHVQNAGDMNATIVANGRDTIFVFAGEPHLKSTVGSTTWYKMDGSVAATAEDIYPDYLGDGYYIEVAGQREYFYVFDYMQYQPRLDSIRVDSLCRTTRFYLDGEVRDMRYTNDLGVTKTLPRTCRISYTDLSWNGEQWQDSLIVLTEQPLRVGQYDLPDAFYRSTTFCVAFESLSEALQLPADSIVSAEVEPIACKAHPTTVTTVRGEKGERTNELDRPTDATVLKGSAPLDILFQSNPTPATEYYMWRIYKGSELIVQRTDQDHRYTFMEPGQYRAICQVTNTLCPCTVSGDPDCQPADSTEFTIAVSESQLLVPNAFTPNGDGKNDEFRVQYRSLREFHCWVYNRWGHLVYEWTDPAKGWDGTINGRPAAEGAYFYVIRAMGTDAAKQASYSGKISYTKKRQKSDESILGVYQLSGDINLIRGK